MPLSLDTCARLLRQARLRHHVDSEEGVVRVVFVTRRYSNARGERLAIVRIATDDEGRRCRVSIERAFPPGVDPAASCLALCRAAAATPLAGIEWDEEVASLNIVSEAAVEDGRLTRGQLLAMVDAVVEAAEAWCQELPAADGDDACHDRHREVA